MVDSRFHEFGKIYYDSMMKYQEKYVHQFESDFIFNSFSKLILSNISFSNSKIFPNCDMKNIKKKIQISLLMDDGYFNLLPEILGNCEDIHFKFDNFQ